MKILFDCPVPYLLAHGGHATQIDATKAALETIGIGGEYLRWWDGSQSGDLIHYFGLPSLVYLAQAKNKNLPIVCTHLLTGTCNRSDSVLSIQGFLHGILMALPGWGSIKNQTTWPVIHSVPRFIVGLEAEKKVLATAFGISPEKISLLPLGLDEDFLQAEPAVRTQPWLVTTGTITQRKRSLDIARFAKSAQTPVLFVGKPYSLSDPYWKEFQKEIDHQWVLHRPHISSREEMIKILQEARGFVLFSEHENWCLSAHEAAACGLPVLLQDQKWSRECFGNEATYWPSQPDSTHAGILKAFYDRCPDLPKPRMKIYSWIEVAQLLKPIYEASLRPR